MGPRAPMVLFLTAASDRVTLSDVEAHRGRPRQRAATSGSTWRRRRTAKKKSDAGQHAVTRDTEVAVNAMSRIWGCVDCSSFVWACYAELGLSASLGWEKWGSGGVVNTGPTCTTHSTCVTKFATTTTRGKRLWGWDERGSFPDEWCSSARSRETCVLGRHLASVTAIRASYQGRARRLRRGR